MTTAPLALDRCRVLVVEDESLIAMDLEGMLRRAGCEVVGPVSRVEAAARRVAEAPAPDLALLDINLGGEQVFALADTLAERRIPFVFLTGYGREVLPERFKGRPVSFKPYTATRLLAMLAETQGGRRGGDVVPPATDQVAADRPPEAQA